MAWAMSSGVPMRPAGIAASAALGAGRVGRVGLDVELRRRRAGADAVDRDAVAAELQRPRARETDQRRLGRGVVGAKLLAAHRAAGDVDDPPEARSPHPRRERLGALDRGAHVERHQVVEVVEGRVLEQRGAHGAHVVDQPRDGAAGQRLLQRPLGGPGIGKVHRHEVVHRVFRLQAVEDHNPAALGAEPGRRRPPDAAGAAGDERVFGRRPRSPACAAGPTPPPPAAEGGVDLGHHLLGQQRHGALHPLLLGPVLRGQHQRAEVADLVAQRQDLLGDRVGTAVDRAVVAERLVRKLFRVVPLVDDEGPLHLGPLEDPEEVAEVPVGAVFGLLDEGLGRLVGLVHVDVARDAPDLGSVAWPALAAASA